jgi:hypothetical protein
MAKVKIVLEIEESVLNKIDYQHWRNYDDKSLYMDSDVTQEEFDVTQTLFDEIGKLNK